ncbi:MAG: tetraacyldisaccharide 4'-kinase [Thermodesulfovibrionales bacterium]
MNLIERLYYIGYSIKKLKDLKNQKKLPYKVISVGNITVGGTGKTPLTISIAEEAKKRGFAPIILTRGYKGKTKGPCFISKGNGPLIGERDAGDEALLMAEKLKDVPIIKGENRYKAGIYAIEHMKIQKSNPKSQPLFILDDGFQHWKLFRDIDVLLIDSKDPFGNKRLLPIGTLREPINAISRADIVIITKAEDKKQKSMYNELVSQNKGLIREIRKYNKNAPIFFAEHLPIQLVTIQGDSLPLEWSKEKTFFAFCGIGNPESFKKTLMSSNIFLKGFKYYRDHYRYSSKDIRNIIKQSEKSRADWIVTTEKDIMRLKELALPPNLVVIKIDFIVDKDFYNEIFTMKS